jgi:hypothetical protein
VVTYEHFHQTNRNAFETNLSIGVIYVNESYVNLSYDKIAFHLFPHFLSLCTHTCYFSYVDTMYSCSEDDGEFFSKITSKCTNPPVDCLWHNGETYPGTQCNKVIVIIIRCNNGIGHIVTSLCRFMCET